MKILHFILTGFLFLALSSCSDLLGSEELRAEVEEKTSIKGSGSLDGYIEIAYFIDGKIASTNSLNTLKVEDIDSIEVSKEPEDYRKYNVSEDTRGIVFITTKKGPKN